MSKKPESTTPDPAPENPAGELDVTRKSRIRQRLVASAGRQMAVVRTDRRPWKKYLPGVEVKMLHIDRASRTQTALWRLQPGARIPAHPHGRDEECFVLEGELVHRGECFRAGDYMLAPAGSRHGTITSPTGAVMLIRGDRVTWRERMFLRSAHLLGR